MSPRLFLPLLPALLLCACGSGDEAASENSDERTATGEVLEGTISDAMLPLDTVTSQPPLLKDQPTPAASGTAGEGGEAAEEGAQEAAEEPAPAAEAPAPAEGDGGT